MKTVKEWREIYVEELTALELTSDEEAIKKEVAEFEEKLRAEYASVKQAKITRLNTAISVLDETIFREEQEEKEKAELERLEAEKQESENFVNDEKVIDEVETSTVVEENLFNI